MEPEMQDLVVVPAMGKSPAKWIKGVLFRKKSSRSTVSKKTGAEKESFIVAKAPSSDLAVNPTSISNSEPCIVARSDNHGIEREETADLSHEPVNNLPGKQETVSKTGELDDADMLRQEQSAAKVQAAFRGYLARRAFWALKGIIRLQALIRGHLVRRQAIATLCCVRGIVKLQALVRGQRVRFSDVGLDVKKVCNLQKDLGPKLEDSVVSKYAFARKLLSSSSSAIPLSLQYDPTESNSAWNWLERWSSSGFWEPLMQPSTVLDSQPQKKLSNSQNVDTETTKTKRVIRRASTGNTENNSGISSSEFGKPKYIPKKSFSLQTESFQENPQNELERVKRSLRKISASTTEANGRSEPVIEKPKHKGVRVSSSPVTDVIEQPLIASPEKTNDPKVEVSDVQLSPKVPTDEPVTELHDELVAELEQYTLENGEKDQNLSLTKEALIPKETETDTGKENQSKTRRRTSLSTKQEYQENGTQNSPTVPSYMAATASAKAKLRGQGSPRLSQDGGENGPIRRHSMPYSSNGKSNSQSPRMQKLAQASAKGGARGDKSLLSSKDYNDKAAVIQEEWRR